MTGALPPLPRMISCRAPEHLHVHSTLLLLLKLMIRVQHLERRCKTSESIFRTEHKSEKEFTDQLIVLQQLAQGNNR